MAGLNRKKSLDQSPSPSPFILDVFGRCALPCRIHKIDSDVFVAGAVLENQYLISLPRTKEDMIEFLEDGGLTALLNVKAINVEYARIVKDGLRRAKKEDAKNRMLGIESSRDGREYHGQHTSRETKVRNPWPAKPEEKQKLD
ncbi:hypothetical protein BG004_000952 [Podila humilis]|nr:hypothetical protein BG004_000952 [Podila humilis]